MIELELTGTDLARTRFAISPLWEVVASVWVLNGGVSHDLHQRWAQVARRQLAAARLDWRLLSDLIRVPAPAIPGFVCPPPATPMPELSAELAAVAATSADRLRADLDGVGTPRTAAVDRLYRDPESGLDELTAVIHRYWEIALAPFWPRILRIHEADIRYRGHLLTTGGVDRLLADLSPLVRADTVSLRLAHRHARGRRSLRGQGLLLVPSVFVWPQIFSVTVTPWQPTLRYPPRGIADLWAPPSGDAPRALARILGRTRGRLLAELAGPASTTDLAARTGFTPGSVSQHLGALRAAGLVDGQRIGRFVFYHRTDAAETLITAATGVGRTLNARNAAGTPAHSLNESFRDDDLRGEQ